MGLDALAQLHDHDRELGVDPSAPGPVVQLGPTPPPPVEFVIEPVDWHEENARREAEQFFEGATPLDPTAGKTRPAPPTEDEMAGAIRAGDPPRIAAVKAWRASQMRSNR